uniref:cell adhesion molecule 1-like n=1 Tax=Scatophagus argus TaxID=75038 RepID=UPI001ED7E59D|nr:cell adhesion molecule 1-like [Scatophagus argus]
MFYRVILVFFSSMSFPCGLRASECDENCADKPVFTPPRLAVKHGDSASAICSVCQHACLDTLFGLEKPVGTKEINGTTISWTVDKLTEWDITVMCYYNPVNSSQCCSILPVTVYKPPDDVSISFVNHNMVEGQQNTLQCAVQNVAPAGKLVVTFYKEQTQLDQLQLNDFTDKAPVTKIFTVNISTSREDNGRQYRCEAKLDLGPEGPQPPPVVKSDSIIATVFYKPHIEGPSHTDPITITEGSPLQLKCSAVGNPSPSYTWTSARNPPSNDSTINIKAVTSADEGEYTCSVSNAMGTATMKFTVIVKSPELTSTSLPPTTTTSTSLPPTTTTSTSLPPTTTTTATTTTTTTTTTTATTTATTLDATTTTVWNSTSCVLINWLIICFMLLFSALI